MRTIDVTLNCGTGAITHYVPVPCRGIVTRVRAVFGLAVANNDTVDVQRGTTSVNLITTGATTAAVVYTGVRDATNKELIFDPASTTAANQVMKIVVSALESANTLTAIQIDYDDFALTSQ